MLFFVGARTEGWIAPSALAAWRTVSYWLRPLWGAVSMVGGGAYS